MQCDGPVLIHVVSVDVQSCSVVLDKHVDLFGVLRLPTDLWCSTLHG